MSLNAVMNKPEESNVFIATANADESTKKVEVRAGLGEAAGGKEDSVKGHAKVLTVGLEG